MKKNNRLFVLLYFFALLLILYYPVMKIMHFEWPRVAPEEFKFRVTVRDPYDPARGRFLLLGFTENMVAVNDKTYLTGHLRGPITLVLGRDADGFAKVTGTVADLKQLSPGKSVLKVETYWQHNGELHYTLPFDRFYINEKLAPEAEKRLGKALAEHKSEVVLTVAVYDNGDFAVRDLLIDGKPIRDFLKK